MSRFVRGDVWIVNLDPVVGHEQGGQRPALIISTDEFNSAGGDDVYVVPITSKERALRTRVKVSPPDGGLSIESYIICDKMRSVSSRRLRNRLGKVSAGTMAQVETILKIILGLTDSV